MFYNQILKQMRHFLPEEFWFYDLKAEYMHFWRFTNRGCSLKQHSKCEIFVSSFSITIEFCISYAFTGKVGFVKNSPVQGDLILIPVFPFHLYPGGGVGRD